MSVQKHTRLTLLDRQEIWRLYQTQLWKVTHLAEHYRVIWPTIYGVLKRVGLRNLPRMTVPINDSRRCSAASNVWLRSSKRFRNVSSAKRSAITSLIRTNSFTSIPSDFPSSNGNPAMNHVSICL